MLKLRPEAWDAVAAEAERHYPAECCGLLLGWEGAAERIIEHALPAPNRHDGSRSRFLILPEDFLAAEREARSGGLDVLGIYHSHPDVAARPSRHDVEGAWPWYSYLIVALAGGRVAEALSYRLDDTHEGFHAEPLEWLDSRGRYVRPHLDSDTAARLRAPTGEL